MIPLYMFYKNRKEQKVNQRIKEDIAMRIINGASYNDIFGR